MGGIRVFLYVQLQPLQFQTVPETMDILEWGTVWKSHFCYVLTTILWNCEFVFQQKQNKQDLTFILHQKTLKTAE